MTSFIVTGWIINLILAVINLIFFRNPNADLKTSDTCILIVFLVIPYFVLLTLVMAYWDKTIIKAAPLKQRDQLTAPEWVTELFVETAARLPSSADHPEAFTLILSAYKDHVAYQVHLERMAHGYDLILGSCDLSYADNLNRWTQINMGLVSDWSALESMVRAMMDRDDVIPDAVWDVASIFQRNLRK